MSFTIRTANFPGRNGESVPWVVVDTGECKGAKRGREGAGINPVLILSILDADHAHLRKVALQAIGIAAPKQASSERFYVWDGQNVLPPVSRDEAISIAESNEDAMFSVPSDKEDWKAAADLGLVRDELPKGPVKKSELPSGPVAKPEATSASGDDKQATLDRINAARGQRVLAAK